MAFQPRSCHSKTATTEFVFGLHFLNLSYVDLREELTETVVVTRLLL